MSPPPASAPAAERHPLVDRLARLWHSVWINLLVCTGIAALLSLINKSGFTNSLVFSVCIGLSIQALIELGRRVLAHWLMARGSRQPGLRQGWPGWPWMGPWVLASAVLGYELGTALAASALGIPVQPFHLVTQPRAMAVLLGLTLAISLGFTYNYYTKGRLAAAEAEAEAARRLASEQALELLQSQLEPHMLFNTLANLRVLIGLDPPRAQAMLDRLIAFLRATLSASRADAHPLAAEFDRLADYLALMAVRMGPRLQVVLDLPPELRALPVPPLLLQPLVENAIQHGLEPRVEGGRLELRARRVADGAQPRLVLTVRDTGLGLPDAALPPTDAPRPDTRGTGFGTTQVRERLQALHGDAARFSLAPADDAEGGTLATITLPWPAAPHAPSPAPAAIADRP